ncbi:MAG: DUF2141 domain-containing protein [Halioglobus sp.]
MVSRWKRVVSGLALLVALVGGQAALAEDLTGILVVEIAGLKDATGDVYIAVYDSDATWLGDEPVLQKKVPIVEGLDGDLVRTELHLPLGEYAMSAFHDKNGNGEMDTNFIGMPREPIAISNNAQGQFGPPAYEDARFSLGAEPLIQRIDMRDL